MIDQRLRTLRVLHEQGTVTATARVLHITPSTVSQQLRQLAKEVGVELLEADGRKVRLTPAALTLVGHADVLFAQWERARADLAAHREGAAGLLRICGIATALAALAAPALAQLRESHPLLTFHMTEEESEGCFQLVLAGRSTTPRQCRRRCWWTM